MTDGSTGFERIEKLCLWWFFLRSQDFPKMSTGNYLVVLVTWLGPLNSLKAYVDIIWLIH